MSDRPKTKMQRCRYCRPELGQTPEGKSTVEYYCGKARYEGMDMVPSESVCEGCQYFDSKYIEYPITVSGIDNRNGNNAYTEAGRLCEVRLADSDRTCLGIYIGEIPYQIHTSYDPDSMVLSNTLMRNPAMFVPELNRLVFGYESWWRPMDKTFQDITDHDIENQPYMRILKAMLEKQQKSE